jgi:hypothetical protein
MPTYLLAYQATSMDCGAGLHPARRFSTGAGRVTNPPQIANLPHNVGQTLSSVNPAIAVTDWPYECSKP